MKSTIISLPEGLAILTARSFLHSSSGLPTPPKHEARVPIQSGVALVGKWLIIFLKEKYIVFYSHRSRMMLTFICANQTVTKLSINAHIQLCNTRIGIVLAFFRETMVTLGCASKTKNRWRCGSGLQSNLHDRSATTASSLVGRPSLYLHWSPWNTAVRTVY